MKILIINIQKKIVTDLNIYYENINNKNQCYIYLVIYK